jgi:hypothetical protein
MLGRSGMTRNAAIKLAIQALRRYTQEHYGNGSKYRPDNKPEYDKYQQAIAILESLKDGKRGENE